MAILPRWAVLLLTLTALATGLWAGAARANPGRRPVREADEKLARVQQFLEKTEIDSKPFQKEMPLARFLQALEKQLPKGGKIVLRVQEDALGKQAAKVTGAPVRLPAASGRMTLISALDAALRQVTKGLGTELAVGVGPDRVVVTTPERAAYPAVYEVSDLLPDVGWILPTLKEALPAAVLGRLPGREASTEGGGAALLRLVFSVLQPRSGEAVQLRNDRALFARVTPARHAELANLLLTLRRQADIAVVMDARVYEVDRAFYAKHFAPLLAAGKGAPERPLVSLSGDDEVLEKLEKEKPLLRGLEIKVRQGQQIAFLALREAFRYRERHRALPGKMDEQGPGGLGGGFRALLENSDRQQPGAPPKFGTGLAGVSLLVRVEVAPDRRFVRLQITQKIEQLVELRKIKYGDAELGYEEIEEPSMTKSSVTTSIKLPDGQPFFMPVVYRPLGARGQDRPLVLVARPRIYIEAEEEQVRNAQPLPVPGAGKNK